MKNNRHTNEIDRLERGVDKGESWSIVAHVYCGCAVVQHVSDEDALDLRVLRMPAGIDNCSKYNHVALFSFDIDLNQHGQDQAANDLDYPTGSPPRSSSSERTLPLTNRKIIGQEQNICRHQFHNLNQTTRDLSECLLDVVDVGQLTRCRRCPGEDDLH